ncbi:MAG: TonB family protein [Pyrinomonadaceae bacterium]
MFDKLIESDTAGAEFKNRSRYFLVSTVIVGILFLTAVVYSLYAAEIGIGNGNFEIAELISPVAPDAPEPEPQRPQNASNDNTQQTSRQILMASTDAPTKTPTSVSTARNPHRSIDISRFENINVGGPDRDGGTPNGRPRGDGTGTSSGTSDNESDNLETSKSAPPPVIKQTPKIVRTSKVLNGDAISLPKPAFPKPAVMLGLEGAVKVQVTIDEVGNVISAKAADGHPFFRLVAEQAARNAKFRPTLLNDVPVKVTGVIVYNFRRTN